MFGINNFEYEQGVNDGKRSSSIKEDILKDEISRLRKQISSIDEEVKLLSVIAMDIAGKDLCRQKAIGKHFSAYSEQDKLPNVRDVIRSLLQIQTVADNDSIGKNNQI